MKFSKVDAYVNGDPINMIDRFGLSSNGSRAEDNTLDQDNFVDKEYDGTEPYDLTGGGENPNFGSSARDNTNVSSFRQTVNPNQGPQYQGRNDKLRETPGAIISEHDKAVSLGIDLASFGSLGGLKLALRPATIKNVKLLMNFKNVEIGGKYLQGSFSMFNWAGYPAGVAKPNGVFRLLDGIEYITARNLANITNAAMRKANPEKFKGLQIHEIHPVKFGGSPTDPANKVFLTPEVHRLYNTFWFKLQKSID